MGDPKKQRRKFFTPSHPWQKARIEEENVLLREYGLKNKREIWKMRSRLKNFADQVKRLAGTSGKQAEKEKQQLFQKLVRLGLLKENSSLGDVLGLTMGGIMEKRLQTRVFRSGMARSIGQARQFIVHGHIKVKGQKMTVPSYLVRADEEAAISFSPTSALSSAEHPEKKVKEQVIGR